MKHQATAKAPTYAIAAPDGRRIHIPATPAEDAPGFDGTADPAGIRAHLAREGYAVVRGLVPPDMLHVVGAAFEAEIRPSDREFVRHASGRLEPHVFTPAGHMLYPIMNPHDLADPAFAGFADATLAAFANARMGGLLAALFDEPAKLTHTMFFDGNQVTWAHQDSYYVDSTRIGAMLGVWVAVEDIHPGAGRFYVYPRSHELPTWVIGRDFPDPNGDAYKAMVLDAIRGSGLACVAPALRKGDAIVFSSLTVHGSLATTEPARSRRSITAHYVPRSHAWWSFHRKVYDVPVRPVDGVEVVFRARA